MVDYVDFARVRELPEFPLVDTVYFVQPNAGDPVRQFITGDDAVPVEIAAATAAQQLFDAGLIDAPTVAAMAAYLTGPSGAPATVTATAATGAPGTSVTVVNGGTPTNRTLAFTIPRGADSTVPGPAGPTYALTSAKIDAAGGDPTARAQIAVLKSRLDALTAFDGVFFDSARNDSFSARMSFPVKPTLTVSNSAIAYSATTAEETNVLLNDENGNPFKYAFDTMEFRASYVLQSFPGTFEDGVLTGFANPLGIFAGEIMSAPSLASRFFYRAWSVGAPTISGDAQFDFVPGDVINVVFSLVGNLITFTFTRGTDTRTLTIVLNLTANNKELPRLFCQPAIRFYNGTLRLISYRVKAGNTNVNNGFLGDSITQGRFAANFNECFTQLARTEHPGQVLIAGAPGATTSDWLPNAGAFCKMRPKKTFVLLGTNDLSTNVPDATTKSNLMTIATQITNSGSTPVIITPPPSGSVKTSNLAAWILAQNWLSVDAFTPLVGSNYAMASQFDSGDGIHPNSAGHAAIYAAVKPSMIP